MNWFADKMLIEQTLLFRCGVTGQFHRSRISLSVKSEDARNIQQGCRDPPKHDRFRWAGSETSGSVRKREDAIGRHNRLLNGTFDQSAVIERRWSRGDILGPWNGGVNIAL